MNIIKYFYEEPAALEVLTDDLDADARQRDRSLGSLEAFLAAPRYNRGYLAGTNLRTGAVGLTALDAPHAYVDPLQHVLALTHWHDIATDGSVQTRTPEDIAGRWAEPQGTVALVGSNHALDVTPFAMHAHQERRAHIEVLRALLDAGAVVAFPEPAHDGFDWSIFAARSLRTRMQAAFAAHKKPNVRCFFIPYQRARSEQKFYFEQWQLDTLPPYIEEV